MRFGVNMWVWVSPATTEEVNKLAPHIKNLGFDWLEFGIEGMSDLDYAKAAPILKDNGLGVSVCVAMGADRDLIHSDPAIQKSGVEYIRHSIDAAATVGATNVVGPIYSAVGRTWQQTADERKHDLDVLVKHLKELGKYAADKGVILCIEPLNRFETSFINLAEQAIEVVDRVDSPGVKVMLDTFHMNIEERSMGDAIRAAGSHLVHFHSCENDRGAPGSGHVPWDEVAQALRDIHYNGPLVIESFTSKVKTIARAAAIWRAFAPTQDDLAKNGLAFLKKQFA